MLFARSTIAAAILAVTLAFAPQAASAKSNIHIGVGFGGWGGGGCWNLRHGGCGWGGYRRHYYRPHVIYYGGYYGGYYGNGYYGNNYGYNYRPVARVGCSKAMAMVRHNGYVRVSTTSCGGKYHVFKARRNGHNYSLKVNSRNGRIAVVARR